MKRQLVRSLGPVLLFSVAACGGSPFIPDSDEVVNSVGDLTASLDEMLAAAGQEAPLLEIFHSEHEEDNELTGPERVSCLTTTPISQLACNAGTKTWTLGGNCSSGLRTAVTGTVGFQFSATDCSLATTGQSIARQVDTVMTGKKLGVLTSTSSSSGQVLTRTDAGFEFFVNDLRRFFEWPDYSTDPMDVTTPTAWVVTGTSRADRVIASGEIEVVHVNFGWTAKLAIVTPLRQVAGCNCPTSGKLSGAITGKETDDQFEIEFTGCGTALMGARGIHTLKVKFDRCAPVS